MELDSLNPIADLSPPTLAQLIRRIEHSTTPEQLVYRECELDEAWRLLGLDGLQLGPAGSSPPRDPLARAILEAHDLVGVNGDVARAAAVLRAALP